MQTCVQALLFLVPLERLGTAGVVWVLESTSTDLEGPSFPFLGFPAREGFFLTLAVSPGERSAWLKVVSPGVD